MSRVIKETNTGFQRNILAEILTPKELKILDKIYVAARIKRELRSIEKRLHRIR